MKRNEVSTNAGAKRKSHTRFGKRQSEVRTFERYEQNASALGGGSFPRNNYLNT
ncbi:MAG: hypothetical protein KBD43_01015 [Saprospiraceae bacterium]|nr:hypothetical protein [Saprospiraceae bacterium]